MSKVIGIIVGTVITASNRGTISLFRPGPRVMAKAALDRVGCGKAVVWGYLPHALQGAFLSLVPEGLARSVIIRTMKSLRDAELKKT
jgi:17beta-estradiol 17-dehydrogenase / very-long-chain 3-oxoacyl-CoA reductase